MTTRKAPHFDKTDAPWLALIGTYKGPRVVVPTLPGAQTHWKCPSCFAPCTCLMPNSPHVECGQSEPRHTP